MVRPKLITFFCIALFIIGALQFVGSVGAIMIGSGIGPEKIFSRDEHVEVPMEEMEAEVPSVQGEEQSSGTDRVVPEHIIPAGKYGLLISFAFIVSMVGLWKMKKWGVYAFSAVSAGNIGTVLVWRPEWLVQQGQNSAGDWMSLLLPILYFAVVLPYWKQLDQKIEVKQEKLDALLEQNPLLKLWR